MTKPGVPIETCPVCRHIWMRRTAAPPRRCPACFAYLTPPKRRRRNLPAGQNPPADPLAVRPRR